MTNLLYNFCFFCWRRNFDSVLFFSRATNDAREEVRAAATNAAVFIGVLMTGGFLLVYSIVDATKTKRLAELAQGTSPTAQTAASKCEASERRAAASAAEATAADHKTAATAKEVASLHQKTRTLAREAAISAREAKAAAKANISGTERKGV